MAWNLRKFAFVAALTVGATSVGLVPSTTVAWAQDQDHHADQDRGPEHDYSNNRYYKLGQREGTQDRKHHKQRANHDHKFRSDDDRQAHDAGYQKGWRGDHDDHQDPH
jgi:hypothetical protein